MKRARYILLGRLPISNRGLQLVDRVVEVCLALALIDPLAHHRAVSGARSCADFAVLGNRDEVPRDDRADTGAQKHNCLIGVGGGGAHFAPPQLEVSIAADSTLSLASMNSRRGSRDHDRRACLARYEFQWSR